MFFLFPYMLTFSPALLLGAAAVIPAIALLVLVWREDDIERESPQLVASLVAAGCLSALCAIAAETAWDFILGFFVRESSVIGRILMYFGVVACSEEGFKYYFLRRRTWRHPEFNYRFDGVVYAVAVSLGFALLENITYVFSYGLGVALIRAFTAIPGHACFGIFMGSWYGQARLYERRGLPEQSRRCLRLALLIPVLLHGTYDFIATWESGAGTVLFLLFAGGMFFYSWRLLKRGAESDTYIG